jgi:hypothetical protein
LARLFLAFRVTTDVLRKLGFVTESITPPDQEHFGNWVLLAIRFPVALRAINDRGVVHLDLMELSAFKSGVKESDWFNWDVVARALGIQETVEGALWSLARNFEKVESAFWPDNWKETLDLLHKIEADKRRQFMDGRRVATPA